MRGIQAPAAPPRPKARDELALVEIDDEAVVYDPASEGVHHLNATAKLVFQLCDGTATIDKTSADLAQAFGAPLATVRHDVGHAVEALREQGLLEQGSQEARVAPAIARPSTRAPVRLDVHPGPCTEKVDRLDWPIEQSYELGPYQLGVRTNSERFGAWLEDALSEFRIADRIGALYSVLVPDEGGRRHRERFNFLYRESLVLARTLDLAEVVRALRFELESFLFADWDEAVLAEAAVVSAGGVSALVPSLTAIELGRDRKRAERAGVEAPPGGRIAIDPGSGRVVPVPPRLDVLEEALGRLAGNDRASRAASSAEGDGLPAFDIVCLPAPLAEARSEPISRALAVRMLAELVPNLGRLGAPGLEGLARLTEGVPCYQLTYQSDLLLDALVGATRSGSAEAAAG